MWKEKDFSDGVISYYKSHGLNLKDATTFNNLLSCHAAFHALETHVNTEVGGSTEMFSVL